MPSANPDASPTLSLCMIVKNEEHFLGRCLAAVRDHVDEIVVVDTGPTDATRVIAAEYGSNLYEFQWNDNYSDARNFALAQAASDLGFGPWLDRAPPGPAASTYPLRGSCR